MDRLAGNISVSHVTFTYGSKSTLILDDVSFDIGAGEQVAIVGRSGSGKSTLINLLLGLLKPSDGSIYIDGLNIDELDPTWLRSRMAVALQTVFLMDGTIRANVEFDQTHLTTPDVDEALRLAQISYDISSMPHGQDTWIGNLDYSLSAGQRQRVAVARAVARNPGILILDEPTSALDGIAERGLTTALKQMNCTRILVTQRPCLAEASDRIVVLERGRLVETGRHEVLMAARGFYYELFDQVRASARGSDVCEAGYGHSMQRAMVDTIPPAAPRRK
jgi:ATP-binding cassette subfamily C protein